MDGDFVAMGEAAMFSLHLPDAVEAHGNDWQSEIFCEQADAGLKRGHAAVGGIVDFSFRKNQDGVAAVGGFAGEAEALPEAGKLRERKNVEERGDQPVAKLIGPAFCEKPLRGGVRMRRSDSPPMAMARRWRNRAGSAARIRPMSARRVM